MRVMYDSVAASAIPTTAALAACYIDGAYANESAVRARCPGATIVRIAVFASTNDGHVLDVENGDATPTQAPGWVQRRRSAGVDATVYCNAGTWPAVQAAFAAAGVAAPHYWIAQYDLVPVIPAGAVAKQYADPPSSGGNYDVSAVADYWPGVDPTPSQPEGLPMKDLLFGQQTGSIQIWVGNGLKRRLVPDVPTLQGMQWWVSQVGGDPTVHKIDNLWVLGDVDPDVTGGLTKVEADLLAAVKAQPTGGQVDVNALAAALLPVLAPADAAALVAALKAQLDK